MVSVTAKHAIRALVHLAGLPPGTSVAGRELARVAAIPGNYLSKILWSLGSVGFIDATRGTGGGYRLRRAPGSIHLIEIVDLFDKTRATNGCFLDGAHQCSDATACAAHEQWRDVKKAYVEFLEHTTLAALATSRRQPASPESRP